ncbi:MAG: hypothetical protein GY839_04930 [candidate division Zixibacteria bacterium]|nr:hypothetical protein [candidate division Zixibacteria bacterium]
MNIFKKSIAIAFLILLMASIAWSYETEYVVVVLLDGIRYTESLGDPSGTYCPLLTDLTSEGVVHDSAFNDVITNTRNAVPATWMGRFYSLQDTSYLGNDVQFCRYPTFWEYARVGLSLPASKAVYVTPDYGTSTWLPSFYPGYGPDYWPSFHHPERIGDYNLAVFDSAVTVLKRDHPVISYIYLPDSDHAGHSGDWEYYIAEILQADSLVAALWDTIQADPLMAGKTTMMVTNDHGRHDDDHGGFQGHGDDCFGCRHVMLFSLGPDFKRNVHVDSPRASIADIAATAGELLGFDTPYSTGRVLEELFGGPYQYLPGDVNMYNGIWPPSVIGGDVTYLVNYFRSLSERCLIGGFYSSADINGDCLVIGSDVTSLVQYFRVGADIIGCRDYPPAWPVPDDLPPGAPEGWPNCE